MGNSFKLLTFAYLFLGSFLFQTNTVYGAKGESWCPLDVFATNNPTYRVVKPEKGERARYRDHATKAYLQRYIDGREVRNQWNDRLSFLARGARRYFMPNEDTFPFYFVENGTSMKILTFLQQIENPGILKSMEIETQKPVEPMEKEVRAWLKKYQEFPADIRHIAQEGFAREFNVRQFQRAIEFAEENDLSVMDGLKVTVANYDRSTGKTTYNSSVFRVKDARARLADQHNQRVALLGSNASENIIIFGNRDKKNEASIDSGDGWRDTGIRARELEQAELHRKLWMTLYRMQDLKEKIGAEPFEPYEGLLKEIAAEISRTPPKGVKAARDHELKQPTAQARLSQYMRELGSQQRAATNPQEAQELVNTQLQRLMQNPLAIDFGFGGDLRGKAIIRAMLRPRTWITLAVGIGVLATFGNQIHQNIIQPVQEWVAPYSYCSSQEMGWSYELCVKKFLSRRFFMEYQRSLQNPEYVPFSDPKIEAQRQKVIQMMAEERVRRMRFFERGVRDLNERAAEVPGQKPPAERQPSSEAPPLTYEEAVSIEVKRLNSMVSDVDEEFKKTRERLQEIESQYQEAMKNP